MKSAPEPDTTSPKAAAAQASAYTALDHLATMVAIVHADGRCVFANAAFEHVLGLSRRSVLRGSLFDWFVDPQPVHDTVAAVVRNDYSTSRLEAQLKRPASAHGETLPVHVIVNQMDRSQAVIVELVEIEQQELRLARGDASKRYVRGSKGLWTPPGIEIEARELHGVLDGLMIVRAAKHLAPEEAGPLADPIEVEATAIGGGKVKFVVGLAPGAAEGERAQVEVEGRRSVLQDQDLHARLVAILAKE